MPLFAIRNDGSTDFFFFVFIVMLAPCVFILKYLSMRETKDAWMHFANATNLASEPSSGNFITLGGTYRNFLVVVNTMTKGSGKSRRRYTQLTVNLHQRGQLTTTISEKSKEGTISSIEKRLGYNDPTEFQVGVPSLDSRFVIKGTPAAQVLLLLNEKGIGEKLLKLSSVFMTVKDQKVILEHPTFVTEIRYLRLLLDTVVDTAEAVDQIH
ncbi:MAG: hypothetical protein WCT04_24985 [Planctomycetota bacterium]